MGHENKIFMAMYNVGLPHIMCVGLCPMQLSRAWRFRYLGWIDIYIYIYHISNVYDIHILYNLYISYTCIYIYIYIIIILYHHLSMVHGN